MSLTNPILLFIDPITGQFVHVEDGVASNPTRQDIEKILELCQSVLEDQPCGTPSRHSGCGSGCGHRFVNHSYDGCVCEGCKCEGFREP